MTAHRRVQGLTPREYEVLRLRATGATRRDVAARLGISEQTVANLSRMAFTRLDVPGMTEAMNALGWVSIPEEAR